MIMADLFINYIPHLRLSDIYVLLARFGSANSHGIIQLLFFQFKRLELEIGLEGPDVSVIDLALVFYILDLLQVDRHQLNSLTHWFAHGDNVAPCLVQTQGLLSLMGLHILNQVEQFASCVPRFDPAL